MAVAQTTQIFGIRHHGPGSARSLRRALEEYQPDIVLVEGPPDAQEVLPLLTNTALRPPVALLVYVPTEPHRAVYYPFAEFSPEWQALHFAFSRGLPARFMDIPQAHQLGESEGTQRDGECADKPPRAGERETAPDSADTPTGGPDESTPSPTPREDPLGWLAQSAGYSDGERWWEHMVEHRRDGADLFTGILEAMAALREAAGPPTDPEEVQREERREAWMRQSIRQALREGFQRVAVVCGAWHAPVLVEMSGASADGALLKGLPKVKVAATWVPWTYGRLCYESGYGAGIESPGWYHHLWQYPERPAVRWMTRVARLLRDEDLDASSASVIEAVRLAEALAAVRDRPLPGLPELNEATQTVLCFGSDTPLKLIHEKLIVSETLGTVPDETPMVPLQQDLVREQRRLRLAPEAAERALDLDLRRATDLERSHLLHRLNLLGVHWGSRERISGARGTFHELWRLRWQPEFAVSLIEASAWGNTVLAAATGRARDTAEKATELPALTALLDTVLLADLPEAILRLMERVREQAALATDVAHLMDALPPLANTLRYGNVRRTDAGMVAQIIDGLVPRIAINLPGACASLNDEAAREMYDRLTSVNGAVALLQNVEHAGTWQGVLLRLADQNGLHGLLAGRATRLLLDQDRLTPEETAQRMSLALSPPNEPAQAAGWVEGLLRGSGLLLLHDDALWNILDEWVGDLSADTFTQLLPLLRRTFSTFPAPERRQMGERARREPLHPARGGAAADGDVDLARGSLVLPIIAQLLGLDGEAPRD
jgi:hypothetical protein